MSRKKRLRAIDRTIKKNPQMEKFIKSLTTLSPLVNLSKKDVLRILSLGSSYISYSGSFNLIIKKVSKHKNAKGMLINIEGTKNITLDKIKKEINKITAKLSDDASVLWYCAGDDHKKPFFNVLIVN